MITLASIYLGSTNHDAEADVEHKTLSEAREIMTLIKRFLSNHTPAIVTAILLAIAYSKLSAQNFAIITGCLMVIVCGVYDYNQGTT